MKAIVVALVVLLSATCAFGQAAPPQTAPVYDHSYQGPMNVYGQPVFSTGPQAPRPQQGQQGRQGPAGFMGVAFEGLESLGSYLWGFMPAPVRGAQSPYQVPPGQGQITVTYTPGTP